MRGLKGGDGKSRIFVFLLSETLGADPPKPFCDRRCVVTVSVHDTDIFISDETERGPTRGPDDSLQAL